MNEDRFEQIKLAYPAPCGFPAIDWLISEVDRLRGDMGIQRAFIEGFKVDMEEQAATIATLRDHLRTDHDIAVSFTHAAGVRHDKQTCATCGVLNGQTKETN